jgi:putative ABC transport system ATP-binding protein
VGLIFQGFHLFPTLTAREQLQMLLHWGEGLPAYETARRTQELLETLNLAHRADLLPHQLSGGEQQRVAIGRALIKRPDLFFADEPTSALDWDHGKQVMETLRAAAHRRCCTALVVTHDPRVMAFADRVVQMEDGAWKSGKATSEIPSAKTLHSPPRRGEELVYT